MGAIPIPRSYEQALSDIIDAFRSNQGIFNVRVGGGLLSTFESAARSDTRSSQDIFALLASIALDRATGLALDRIGNDEQVPRIQESPATGLVTVSDSSFTKVFSKVFQGSAAPIAGSVSIDISDASFFPNSGNIYIGRGTSAYEGPLHYTTRVNNGTHWTLTLSVGTTRFHNTSESVILAQGGNRTIGAGAVVRTPQGNVSNAVSFNVLYSYTLPDGETSIPSVQVVCQQPGLIGNVSAAQIKEFSTPPFSGATVTNPNPFSNGRITELDDPYRERIKDARASRQAGTSLAITTAVTGITAPDENKRISSASLVKHLGAPSSLYIDDGTGYEDQTAGVPIETLADFAIGGENTFQTNHRPLARAFIKTNLQAPYILTPESSLTVRLGGTTYLHNFQASEFTSISNASAYEVSASINANPTLGFSSRTADAGTNVVIFGKSDVNEDIEILATQDLIDANASLGFPTGTNFTAQLYKNDILLSKDGLVALLNGLPFFQWNAMAVSQTLIIAVDNTPALTYTFVDQDFIDAGTGFPTLGKNSVNAWAAVINAKIPGITAVNNAEHLVLTSNAGPVSKSSIEIVGGTLVSAHLFVVGKVVGKNRDYIMDRNAGQIELQVPLLAGDKLTVGSTNSRSFIQSPVVGATNVASVGKFWFVVDGAATVIKTGITGATIIASMAVVSLRDWGHLMTLTVSSGTPFTNVQPGDYMILWDPAIPASLLGSHRVVSVTGNSVTVQRRLGTANRVGHSTCALAIAGGLFCKVLSTGGTSIPIADLTSYVADGATDSCSLYDHTLQLDKPAGPLNQARAWHTTTLLANGKVLVAGGRSPAGVPLTSLEIYDPTSDTWSLSGANLTTGVFNHTATLLTSGSVLIAGGDNGSGGINSYQIYNPGADTLSVAGTMAHPRARHKAVKMPNDNVLVVGGYDGASAAQLTCEIFSAGALTFSNTGSMHRARYGMGLALVGAVALPPTTILVAGNHRGAAGNTTYEVYDIAGTTWGAETALPSNCAFEEKDLLTLTNGDVVGLHGFDSVTNTTGRGFKDVANVFSALGTNSLQTDTSTKWQSTYAEISNGIGIANIVCAVGGAEQLPLNWNFQPTAQIEEFNEGAGSVWTVPDPAAGLTATLTSVGAVFVRTDQAIQEIDVPVGTNYTATTLASVIDGNQLDPGLSGVVLGVALLGGTATVYQSNKVRVATNTYETNGNLALVTQNTTASAFGLPTGSYTPNLPGHVGSLQSKSELGSPMFRDSRIVGTSKGAIEQVVLGVGGVSLGDALVGLKDWWRGTDGTSAFGPASFFYPKAGDNYNFRTRMKAAITGNALVRVDPRLAPIEPWMPLNRAYLAAPFAIGPNDNLTVLVDNDTEKTYPIRMARTLNTIGTTYSSTDSFKDGDGGGVSIAVTFGLNFDFNDFAVYMPSRTIAFLSDANRAMLFRYYRLGAEGDSGRVRFGNPTAPSQPLSVSVSSSSGFTDTTIRIQSGAARTLPNIHSTTKMSIGQISVTGGIETRIFVANLKISTASRTANVDHATTTLPAGVTDHGLQILDKVYVNSTDINFTSGLKTVTARTATTFDYAETAADIGATANIGTVSRDVSAEASFTGGGVIVGDYYMNGTLSYRISVVDGSGGWVKATSGDNGTFGSSSPGLLLTIDNFYQIFAGSNQTTAVIAAAVNALAGAANSTCPITATLIGDGTGTVNQSTPDLNSLSTSWYILTDGLNWIKTTTAPGSIAGDYSFTLKKPITGTLSTGSDWNHETVKIAPTTTKNVVDWLNAPTVSGLFTVCSIQAADDGRRVQIASLAPGSQAGVTVQGGLANIVTSAVVGSSFTDGGGKTISIVDALDTQGMSGGMWARIQNEVGLPIPQFFTSIRLSSWTSDGLMTFLDPIISTTPIQAKMQFEKQGDFVAISDMGLVGNLGVMAPGRWIRISGSSSPTVNMPQVSSSNEGIFRILRADNDESGNTGTVWIENFNVIEERSECTVSLYDNTPVAGDQLVLSDPIWGLDNLGVWTISAVGETTAGSGDIYAHNDRLTVDISSRVPAPQGARAALTNFQAGLNYIVEGVGAAFVVKVDGIYPNQTDGSFANVRWDYPVGYSFIGGSAGSIINMVDKLNFPIDPAVGVDAYRYNTGLIGEANRIVYGDPADTSTYPGIAADGSRIGISGPLIKRIKLSLLLRVRSIGVTNADVGDRVRSAVATVINQSQIGEAIAFSTIVAAAEKVVGVASVTVLAPIYGLGNDLIPLQPAEKALVLDLANDIKISFTGE